jgi:hypothetical protein
MSDNIIDRLPAGIATGLGSTPFTEAAPALAMIRHCVPLIPHWPQLPRRGVQEGLIFQALRCLVETGLIQVKGDQAVFDTAAFDWPERLTEFYTICLEAEQGSPEALARFAFSPDAAAGFTAFIDELHSDPAAALIVKGQVVGPLTMGFRLKDGAGNRAFYDEQLRDLVNRTLALHAAWQCARLAETGLPVLLFIDDPTVAAYGTHAHIALTREKILESLNTVIEAIHHQAARVGIHSCDATDWSLLFASGTDIVSFDAYRFSDSMTCYAPELQVFLERGGRVAWGIVPTSEDAFSETRDSLLARLYDLWNRLADLGVDRQQLRQQSMITPACGTGLLSEELAQKIYALTAEVSAAVGE